MTPEELKQELEIRGVKMLGIWPHHSDPDMLVIYLDGNAGQWADGFAKHLVAGVPGVRSVQESVPSPTVLLAVVPLTGGD